MIRCRECEMAALTYNTVRVLKSCLLLIRVYDKYRSDCEGYARYIRSKHGGSYR